MLLYHNDAQKDRSAIFGNLPIVLHIYAYIFKRITIFSRMVMKITGLYPSNIYVGSHDKCWIRGSIYFVPFSGYSSSFYNFNSLNKPSNNISSIWDYYYYNDYCYCRYYIGSGKFMPRKNIAIYSKWPDTIINYPS